MSLKMAPKTSTEKSRLFRERLKSDPIKYAEFLRKDRERYKKKKQQGLKSVKEMSVSDQKKSEDSGELYNNADVRNIKW